jgi:alkanesulfonate monooxygenase SsuD/methylene tetrahydromethanopterin reductase-like flavin-dependent oxidoreductase (luciferase family)
MKELIAAYREGWRAGGHPGSGRVMLAFHLLCARTDREAASIARGPLDRYLRSLVDAASEWTAGMTSKDYPGYDKIIEGLRRETFESQVEKHAAWVGTPARIVEQIHEYDAMVGGFDIASLQVNFNDVAVDDAERSMRLFAEDVMPAVRAIGDRTAARG